MFNVSSTLKKLRFWLRFVQVYARRYGWIVGVGILLGVVWFVGGPRVQRFLPKFRQAQTIGIVGKYTESTLPLTILSKVSLGLTQIDDQGRVFPAMAKRWEADREGKNWTFELDNNLTWSDGKRIEAGDLQFSFDEVQINATQSSQIVFRLQDSFSPFPSIVSVPTMRTDFIGIGPYRFSKFKRAGQFLKSAELVPVNNTSLAPRLRYIFYGTEEAARIDLKLGKLQKLEGLLQADEFANWPNLNISQQSQPYRYVGLIFNTRKENFKDKRVRQALAYAVKNKNFNYERVISPVMQNSWAYNPNVKPYEYDLDHAKNLWKQNGTSPADEKPENSASTLELSTVSSLLPVAESISRDWQELGVTANVRVVNEVPEDFDVLLVTQEVPSDPDQYALWHSTQPSNLTGYKSPKVDKLLEDGRKELNMEKRKTIYLDFQKYLLEDLPVIFLFRPVTYTIEKT